MTIREYFAKRRERHIDAMVNVQAKGAAERIIEILNLDDQPTSHRHNAWVAPNGINQNEYARRIGETAITLVRSEMDCPFEFDPDASRQATEEFEALPARQIALDALPSAPTPPETIVIFSRRAA
jgi:hypothetical protein